MNVLIWISSLQILAHQLGFHWHKRPKGKYFNCRIEGRLGETTGMYIVEKLEETIKYSLRYKEHDLEIRINNAWEELVFTGPGRVT